MITIRGFAKLCGCNTQTLRYYDRIGLLTPAKVDEWTGYRYYEEEQALLFVKIKNLQQADFSIDVIGGEIVVVFPRHLEIEHRVILINGVGGGDGLRVSTFFRNKGTRVDGFHTIFAEDDDIIFLIGIEVAGLVLKVAVSEELIQADTGFQLIGGNGFHRYHLPTLGSVLQIVSVIFLNGVTSVEQN